MSFIIKRQLRATGIVAVLGLAACSGSGTSPQTPTQANVTKDVLQFAVGTANIYGDTKSVASVGLNVAATYRQPTGAYHTGDSAVFVSSPTIVLPGALTGALGTADGFLSTVETGPSATEQGGHQMTSTPQAGSTTATTFGTSGGVFGLGIEPFNYNEGGSPDNVAPYTIPLYDALAADANAFVPWGGPPAFDPAGDGTGVRDQVVPSGTLGVPEGLDVFSGVTPVAGQYQLNVAVPANTGTTTASLNASLGSTAVLPAFKAAVVSLDSAGGANPATTAGAGITVTLPAGVTEAYVQVTDFGPAQTATSAYVSCNGSAPSLPTYYTIIAHASGTYTLGDNEGPGPAPSICTPAQNAAANSGTATGGDEFTIQLVGFDYPWFEASYPNSNGNPSPAIANASGQADITISTASGYVSTASNAVRTQLHFRHSPFSRLRG